MLHENILEECAEAEDGLRVGGDLVQPEPEPDRGDTLFYLITLILSCR